MLRSYRTQLCLVTINNIRLPINNVGIKTAIFNQGYTNKSLTVFDSNFRASDITMFSVTPITIAPHRTEAMLYMTLTFPSQLMTSAVMNRHRAIQSLQSLLGTHAGKKGTHVARRGIRVIWEGLDE